MKLGFIGLGIMGKPMALNLLSAGYCLNICDLNQEAVSDVAEKGGIPYKTAKEVAQESDMIFTMLPNSPHVKAVLLGENGVLEGLKKGTVIVDMSSIDPIVSAELEKEVVKAGGDMIDAPVSGGEPKAIDATLSFMCGGREEIFKQAEPVLRKMGASVVLVGPIGSGNMTKLANQIIVAVNIAAVSEAFVMAVKSGVNPEAVFHAIQGGLAGSTVMTAKVPMMLERNFNPGFKLGLHIKDLTNAMNASEYAGMELPLTRTVLGMMEHLKDEGMELWDHSAIVRYYEEKEAVEVKR